MLASGSPRRREMLERLGLPIRVRPVDLDESVRAGEPAAEYVRRLAAAKAAHRCELGELVIAADTSVVRDQTILGKPADTDDARRMLRSLAGRTHRVLTAVALARRRETGVEVALRTACTEVDLKPLTETEIDWYVATGEGLDKAGAYAIQGHGAFFVTANRGSYSNVVGLPLAELYEIFSSLGYSLLDWVQPPR